ncbi:MAG: hypothetical protein ACRD29_25780 [Acidimicrobiales bacterium]
MPDPGTITTSSGRQLRLTDLNLRVPYSMYCTLYGCSFDHLGHMLQNFKPLQQPNLQLNFLEPVSKLIAGSSVSLFEYTYPRVGPVVVQTGLEAATNIFRTGTPDMNATGNVELRTRVWRELHFYVNGEVQVNGSANGLELDHDQFTFGFKLVR